MKLKSDIDAGTITFTFDDDTPDATFNANDVHFDLCVQAMMFGFTNKIKDTAAIARKQSDNSVIEVTESMRRAKVVEMIDHLTSGGTEWNLKGTARAPKQNAAILALATRLDKTYEEAEAYIANLAIAELSE